MPITELSPLPGWKEGDPPLTYNPIIMTTLAETFATSHNGKRDWLPVNTVAGFKVSDIIDITGYQTKSLRPGRGDSHLFDPNSRRVGIVRVIDPSRMLVEWLDGVGRTYHRMDQIRVVSRMIWDDPTFSSGE